MTRQREGETKTVYDATKEQIVDSIYELPDHVELAWTWMGNNIKSNGCHVQNIKDVENSIDLSNIFQTFYKTTGRLPLSSGLLIFPDGDAPHGEDGVNMKSLYDMFRHTNFCGLVSSPFWGALQYYFDANDLTQIKNALTELYQNLSYITLIGAREFEFSAVSDLVARISYLIKAATLANKDQMEKADKENAYKVNECVSFVPKTEKPLDVVIDVIGEDIKYKKMTHPYVPPQAKTAAEIEAETQSTNNEFAKLKAEYDTVNDAATEQIKQTEKTDLVHDIIDGKEPFSKSTY